MWYYWVEFMKRGLTLRTKEDFEWNNIIDDDDFNKEVWKKDVFLISAGAETFRGMWFKGINAVVC